MLRGTQRTHFDGSLQTLDSWDPAHQTLFMLLLTRYEFRATFRNSDGSTRIEENYVMADDARHAERLAYKALDGYRAGRLIGVIVKE